MSARRIASETPRNDPRWREAQLILGEIALRSADAEAALRHYGAIPKDGSPIAVVAGFEAGRIAQKSGRLSAAIESYASVLEQDPTHIPARKEIANLYAVTGQRPLADLHLVELMKSQELDFRQLVWLTDYERRHSNDAEFLTSCASRFPDDPAVNLGLSAEEIARGDWKAAKHRLQRTVQSDPRLAAAQGLLGELLLDEPEGVLKRWHAELPDSVSDEPEIWYVRGLWARRRGEDEVAARCFWECSRRIPTSYRPLHQLALVLAELDSGAGRAISEGAQDIFRLRQNLSKALNSRGRDEGAMRNVVEILLSSGREWEAWTWAVFTRQTDPHASWVAQVLTRLSSYPDPDAPRVLSHQNLLARHDLSHYPGFEERFANGDAVSNPAGSRTRDSRVMFVEQAAELGIDFVYHQGRADGDDGVRMQETTGGGIGVLDFDCDSLPDLFLTQGEDWNSGSDVPASSGKYQDALYRNEGTRFRDVTRQAGLPLEGGFGQGCSVGDFDNDGFADIYVANIGLNRLLINQGDGTFRDATGEAGLTATAWTSSCLIADLNADGSPDLFDVNYLQGEHVFRMICNETNCSPEAYESAADHLHLSHADGTFRTSEVDAEEDGGGAGLAVVAFRLDAPGRGEESPAASALSTDFGPHQKRLCLFIGNDQEPNFLLINTPAENADRMKLTDSGFLRGVAVNVNGAPTACMGVASGDANGDGLLDLFVTNYMGEANNLYVQSPGGYFSDAIAGTGTMAAGLPYVGWGTQFLDADNDGRQDLIVANGHVADFGRPGVAYDMPTQFFYNQGDSHFEEVPPERVGPFFERKILGRSVATLDWNRDGLTDFALSPIASEFALLTNRTTQAGGSLTVRLHATSTARDAIGALVTITTDSGVFHQQLTAGDGYQVTNERCLRFGLGDQKHVRQIVIEWPGGLVQTIEDVPADTAVQVVEGRAQLTSRALHSAESDHVATREGPARSLGQ